MWIKNDYVYNKTSENIETYKKLPSGNYMMMYDEMKMVYYLEKANDFTFPEKIYGNIKEDAKFYSKRHEDCDSNLGLLLVGEKGSGKSMLAKRICMERNLPVIMIPSFYEGNLFKSFILQINQPIVIFIDEYDKIYSDSNELLSLMDGLSNSNILWLLTSNEPSISYYLKNRPSRIRYVVNYLPMTDDEVREVLDDFLKVKNQHEVFIQLNNIYEFNFDLLLSLIREVNETGKDLKTVLRTFNVYRETENYEYVVLNANGEKLGGELAYDHPFSGSVYVNYYLDDEYKSIRLSSKFLTNTKKEVNKNVITIHDGELKYIFTREDNNGYTFSF